MSRQSSGGLSPSQMAKGLRVFLLNSSLLAVWSSASAIGASIVTGYLLWMGATDADIARLTSIAFLVSLTQILTLRVTGRVRNKKLLVGTCGFLEITFRFLAICVPLVFLEPRYRIHALYVVVILGLFFSHAGAPTLSDWVAKTIPENLRARFTSQRTLVTVLTSLVAGFLLGRFLDIFPEGEQRYQGFFWVFVIGLIAGLGSYAVILRAPLPPLSAEPSEGTFDALKDMVRDRSFRALLGLQVAWQFVVGISSPFYSVYMLQDLHLSYTTIAIYTAVSLTANLVGNHVFGGLVSRFGSKPVLLLMLVPGAMGHFLRNFARPDFHLLLPISFACYATLHAAFNVALTPLFYSKLPDKEDRTAFFSAWIICVYVSAGLAPLAGAYVTHQLQGIDLNWFGFPIRNHQLLFMCTTAGTLAVIPLVLMIEERKADSASTLLGTLWKGNPVAYLYNRFVMDVTDGESQRIRATAGMGLSGSPLAVDELIRGLTDLSPEVRRKAAEGLKDIGSDQAVGALMEQVANPESDIRAEAAEALGRIRHPLGVDALLEALDDADSRVRISAVRGLGDVGGPGIQKLLYERLQTTHDRHTFPTLVDVLSRMGDTRIVEPVIRRLPEFTSPVIRAQLLNAIGRALGASEDFYRLAVCEELRRATRMESLLDRNIKDLASLRGEFQKLRDVLLAAAEDAHGLFEKGQTTESFQALVRLARHGDEALQTLPAERHAGDDLSKAREAARAILLLADTVPSDRIGAQEFLFAVIGTGIWVHLILEADASRDPSAGNEGI